MSRGTETNNLQVVSFSLDAVDRFDCYEGSGPNNMSYSSRRPARLPSTLDTLGLIGLGSSLGAVPDMRYVIAMWVSRLGREYGSNAVRVVDS